MTITCTRAATTGLTLSALILLTACGAADTAAPKTDGPSSKETAEAAKPSEAAVEGFAVGEPFGEAVWSIDVDGATTVNVRPDRVIVDTTGLDSRAITAYTAQGEQAWTHDVSGEYPEDIPVWVLDETVAILGTTETEGSGLDKDQTTEKLTLLSQEDGSTVAEVDDATVNDDGVIVVGEDEILTEDGKTVAYDVDESEGFASAETIHGIPIDPEIKKAQFAGGEILATDRKQDIAILDITSGATAEQSYYGVDAETGKIAYELECPGFSHTDGENNVALNSPNGTYGVHESIWISSVEATCYGGGDEQKKIEFTAVDDDGTAYGVTKENMGVGEELVVIPKGEEPELFDAPVPVGVTNGGIAVHIDGTPTNGNSNETIYEDATTVTGNPIK